MKTDKYWKNVWVHSEIKNNWRLKIRSFFKGLTYWIPENLCNHWCQNFNVSTKYMAWTSVTLSLNVSIIKVIKIMVFLDKEDFIVVWHVISMDAYRCTRGISINIHVLLCLQSCFPLHLKICSIESRKLILIISIINVFCKTNHHSANFFIKLFNNKIGPILCYRAKSMGYYEHFCMKISNRPSVLSERFVDVGSGLFP